MLIFKQALLAETGHDHPEFDLQDYVGAVIMESGYVWHYLLLDSPDEEGGR